MDAGNFDFDTDVRSEVLKFLPHDPTSATLAAELNGLDTGTLLIRYLNWRNRLVHAHKRQVFIPRELAQKVTLAGYRPAFQKICRLIELGGDLTPFLSKSVTSGYMPRDPRNPLKHNSSLDLLLNEWGMHHLHLSDDLALDGFTVRTNNVLIIMFRLDSAYCVDVVNHGEWAEESLVEIAYRNWPGQNFFVPLQGVIGIEQQTSSKDRLKLRRAGVATSIIVDSKMLMPANGGITTAGTATRTSLAAMRILQHLHFYFDDAAKLVSAFVNAREMATVNWPSVADFHVRFLVTPAKYCIAIQELHTGQAIAVE